MSGMLVVAEHRRGEVRPATLEVIGASQRLKRSPDDTVTVALIGKNVEELVSAVSVQEVNEIVIIKVEDSDFNPEVYEVAVHALIAERKPTLVLLPHSVDSMGYAPALAVKGKYGFATDVFKVEYQGPDLVATRGGYGQKINIELDFPGRQVIVLTLRPNVFKPADGTASPKVTVFDSPPFISHSRHLRYVEQLTTDDIDIASSEFILAIGRGVGEEANVEVFKELADAIGATLACSRPIADSGWLPKSRQVGQSGKVASQCKLYIAMGISGAIQHLAGMKHINTIVAVNTDPQAPIFSVAKYGIVGDIFKIAEALRSHFA